MSLKDHILKAIRALDKPEYLKRIALAVVAAYPATLTAEDLYLLRNHGVQIPECNGAFLYLYIPVGRVEESIIDQDLVSVNIADVAFHLRRDLQAQVNEITSKLLTLTLTHNLKSL